MSNNNRNNNKQQYSIRILLCANYSEENSSVNNKIRMYRTVRLKTVQQRYKIQ